MKKIVAILLLSLNSMILTARYGIGYTFFNRRVLKKVYSNQKRNIMRTSDIPIKMKQGADLLNDFELILSKRGLKSYSEIKPHPKRVSHPLKTTDIKKVLKIDARFKYAWNNYVELKPKKKIILPKWTKSLDLWAYGIKENLDVYIYLSTKPNTIRRIKLGRLNYFHWHRLYANIFDVRYKNEREIHLVKIRIIGHRQNAVKHLITFMAGLNVYNFKRTHKNLYLNPVRNLFNVDKTENINWKLQIGENSSSKNFYRRIFDKQRNRPVLHVLIPEQEHKNLDCMVFFGKKLILLRNYKISIWLKSMGNREKISLIFRDYKKRLFEVEFAHIKFNGWKRMVLKVPDKFFIPIGKGNYIRPRFLELWGMKISPSYKKNIEFRMGDIKSFRDFRFEKVKIPGR